MYSNWFVSFSFSFFFYFFSDPSPSHIGRLVSNPFHEGDQMTKWYHAECIFIALTRARATTKKIGLFLVFIFVYLFVFHFINFNCFFFQKKG